MEWLAFIGQLFKIAMFFLDLWREKNKKKAAEKAEIAKEIVDAFKQTNKSLRASYLNSAIVRMRNYK